MTTALDHLSRICICPQISIRKWEARMKTIPQGFRPYAKNATSRDSNSLLPIKLWRLNIANWKKANGNC